MDFMSTGAVMRLHLRALIRATVILCLAGQSDLIGAHPQSATDSTDLQLFVTAFAKDDSPAVLEEPGLSVLVDKAPAQVKAVRSVKEDPLLFAVLVDISKSDASSAEAIKEAALQLFQRLASAQNQGYLVLFNDRIFVSRDPISASKAKEMLDSAKFESGTSLYDAIVQTCKQKLSRSGNLSRPRRVILVISDGEDNASHVTHTEAEEAALEEGVAVFSLVTNPRSSSANPGFVVSGKKVLREVSERTGGFATDKDLKKAVPLALAALDAQWMIAFAPPHSVDSKRHSIKVKCLEKGVHIYAPGSVLVQ